MVSRCSEVRIAPVLPRWIPASRSAPGSPLPGLVKPEVSPFSDVLDLLTNKLAAGTVKVLLIHGVNPVFELPAVAGLKNGFKAPFVVSFNPLVDESAVWADLVMPDRNYLEAWGYDVVSPGFGMPVVSGQQPVVTPVFDSRATAEAARALGADEAMQTRLLPGMASGFSIFLLKGMFDGSRTADETASTLWEVSARLLISLRRSWRSRGESLPSSITMRRACASTSPRSEGVAMLILSVVVMKFHHAGLRQPVRYSPCMGERRESGLC